LTQSSFVKRQYFDSLKLREMIGVIYQRSFTLAKSRNQSVLDLSLPGPSRHRISQISFSFLALTPLRLSHSISEIEPAGVPSYSGESLFHPLLFGRFMSAVCIRPEKFSLSNCPSASIRAKADQYDDPLLVFVYLKPSSVWKYGFQKTGRVVF
jgi:hypothetical protein